MKNQIEDVLDQDLKELYKARDWNVSCLLQVQMIRELKKWTSALIFKKSPKIQVPKRRRLA